MQVVEGKSAYNALNEIRLFENSEFKVYGYGKSGYLRESRWAYPWGWTDWQITYYIEQGKHLYVVEFRPKGVQKRISVSIDGYGKVNY